jgi:uncharacterized protein GlcG (DUF336 family)
MTIDEHFLLSVTVLSAHGAKRTIDAAEQRALAGTWSVSIAEVATAGASSIQTTE